MLHNELLYEVKKAINSNDEKFNTTAISVKIENNYNLVIWCDLDEDRNNERCFIVSIRENEYDGLFGDDIGIEYITEGITIKELEETISKAKKELKSRCK